ncbi:MAG: D-glycero-beta-D-manno-heptose 1-phosphate adenylyltransferase [Planctomycetes bacterium]|nr:D-glycero-beta-D-manno-heptose 1-phosphate adenylyltransferase [Planctomycetota bacterium]
MPGRLIELLEHIGRPKIFVIGDLMLDKYVFGRVDRISPEAPIQVLKVENTEDNARPGGAGCVMLNLCHLGANVVACGVVGADDAGAALKDALRQAGASTQAILSDRDRPTPVKTRYRGYVQSAHRAEQHLLRVDEEETHEIPATLRSRLIKHIKRAVPSCDVVVVADYDKGLLSRATLKAVFDTARGKGIPVLLDPKQEDFGVYQGATAITPNRFETQMATGMSVTIKTASEAGQELIRRHGFEHVFVTLDKEGMVVCPKAGRATRIETAPREVADVTGAGDMVISVLGLAMAAGADAISAAKLANVAAGIEVGKVGVAPVSRKEIIRELHLQRRDVSDKIVSQDEIEDILKVYRQRNETIVFTNGCFDLLHPGHVQYLEFARGQGDVLVVGLNADRSVRAIKGKSRPVMSENDRARVLAGLASVDYIVFFGEPTPARLIRRVKPDVLVKGEDWREKGVVGQKFVERRGGKVILTPLSKGVSTTNIIQRILELNRDK